MICMIYLKIIKLANSISQIGIFFWDHFKLIMGLSSRNVITSLVINICPSLSSPDIYSLSHDERDKCMG